MLGWLNVHPHSIQPLGDTALAGGVASMMVISSRRWRRLNIFFWILGAGGYHQQSGEAARLKPDLDNRAWKNFRILEAQILWEFPCCL